MVQLVAGKALSSRAPTILVENAFPPGRVAFELVVVDDQGNTSAPVRLVVSVSPLTIPIGPPRPPLPPLPSPTPIPIPIRPPKPPILPT